MYTAYSYDFYEWLKKIIGKQVGLLKDFSA